MATPIDPKTIILPGTDPTVRTFTSNTTSTIPSIAPNSTITINNITQQLVYNSTTGGGIAAGNIGEVQINENGVLAGDSGLQYNNVSDSLLVAGSLTASSILTNQILHANGVPFDFANAGASGSNAQIQYNNNGSLGGTVGFTYNNITQVLTLPTVANVKMAGGTSGQVLSTDGAGNLSWSTGSSGGNSLVIANEYHVATNGNDTTGNGSQSNPFATIGNAIARVGANAGYKVIVHAGSYTENVTISTTNTTLVAAQSDVGASPLINGTLIISGSATSVKVQGISANTINVTTSGTAYFTQTKASNAVNKTGSGYMEVIDSDWAVAGGNALFNAGTSITNGTKLTNVQVQGTAIINIKNSIQVANVIVSNSTSAVVSIDDSYVYAPTNGANAVQVINGALTTRSSLFVNPDLTLAKIGITTGFLGYDDISFDKANSTLGAGLNAMAYFQDIDAEAITASGNITAGNAALGNLVTANYFNGSLVNGNSNIVISANANIILGVAGSASALEVGANSATVKSTNGNLVLGRANSAGAPGLSSTSNLTFIANRGNTESQLVLGTDGNLTLPGNTFSVNYANGNQVQLGSNTGNVTFNNQIVIGTGSNDGSGGLYLAPGNASIANSAVQYFRVRGGDNLTHIHLDTGNNLAYDQYFGDDSKYLKLELGNAGNVVIGTDNGNASTWSFGSDGRLTFPGTPRISTADNNFEVQAAESINFEANSVVNIYTDSSNNTYQWQFGDDGAIILPTNGNINFASGGGINQTLNEDFYIRASDDESDGWSIYNTVDDGSGNVLSQTRLEFDQYSIRTDAQGAAYTWAFRDTGVLDLPGDIYGNVGGNLTIKIGDQSGSNTFIDLQTRSYVGDALISNIHIDTNVTISTSSSVYNWKFDNTGNLTVPKNILGLNSGDALVIDAGASNNSILSIPSFQDGGEQLVIKNDYGSSQGIRLQTETGNFTFIGTTLTAPEANVTGNLIAANASFSGANVSLGAVANLKITGGSNLQYLRTDGAGNLSWAAVSAGSTIANGNSNVSIDTSGGIVTFGIAGNANVASINGLGIMNLSDKIVAPNADFSATLIANVIDARTINATANINFGNSSNSGEYYFLRNASSVAMGAAAGQNIVINDANGIQISGTGGVTLTGAAGANISLQGIGASNPSNITIAAGSDILFGSNGNANAFTIGANSVTVKSTNGNLVLGRATATGSPGLSSTTSMTFIANRGGTEGNMILGTDGNLSVSGSLSVAGNANISGNLAVSNITQLVVPGGTSGQFITTDGTGNLSFSAAINLAEPTFAPTLTTSILSSNVVDGDRQLRVTSLRTEYFVKGSLFSFIDGAAGYENFYTVTADSTYNGAETIVNFTPAITDGPYASGANVYVSGIALPYSVITFTGGVTANVTAGGALQVNVAAGYSNTTAANYLASNANISITVAGNVTAGNLITTGSLSSAANLSVTSGSNSWVFATDGKLILPGGGNIAGDGSSPGPRLYGFDFVGTANANVGQTLSVVGNSNLSVLNVSANANLQGGLTISGNIVANVTVNTGNLPWSISQSGGNAALIIDDNAIDISGNVTLPANITVSGTDPVANTTATITNRLPITINGNTYYIMLTS